METKYNQEKEAEAFGKPPSEATYIIPFPTGKSALGMAPPLYYDTPGQKWSWCNLVTSAISLFFCAFCGVIATIMAMTSYTDHKARDFARSHKKRKLAYGFAITGIVIGSIFLIGYIIMMANFYGMEKSHFRDDYAYGVRPIDIEYYTSQVRHPDKGERPDTGKRPETGQRPNEGERPDIGKRPGVGQRPNEGQRSEMGKRPGMGQRPNEGQRSEMGKRPGIGQPPNEGQRPDIGKRPEIGQPPNEGQRPDMGHHPDMDNRPDMVDHANMGNHPDMDHNPNMGHRPQKGQHHFKG